jgi:hypothetical protein
MIWCNVWVMQKLNHHMIYCINGNHTNSHGCHIFTKHPIVFVEKIAI